MFMTHYDENILGQLTKCLRVFPHDQDTSGFFITIIRKLKDFDANCDLPQQEEAKAQPQKPIQTEPIVNLQSSLPLIIQKRDRIRTFEFTRCDATDPDIQYIQAYYGLLPTFPVDQLITQSPEMNKLFFISPSLSRFLYADSTSHHLNIINMGVQLFMRNQSKFFSNSECIFRISQDGILNVIPYMTKRLIWMDNLEQLRYFLTHKNVEDKELPGDKLREDITDLTTGCFVLALRFPGPGDVEHVEALTMHRFPHSVNMMVSREHIFSLQLRYLEKEERENVAKLFELDK